MEASDRVAKAIGERYAGQVLACADAIENAPEYVGSGTILAYAGAGCGNSSHSASNTGNCNCNKSRGGLETKL